MISIFIDVETTGTRPVEDFAVIQIAGIVCKRENCALVELESFDFTCAPYPRDVISAEALTVNGKTLEQIRAYEAPQLVHGKLVEALGRHVDKFNKSDKAHFYAYNASFDADHLRAWFAKAGDKYFGSWFWTPAIDVMSIAADELRDERASMPNFKLATVAEKLGVQLTNAHDALADVRCAKAIYDHITRVA